MRDVYKRCIPLIGVGVVVGDVVKVKGFENELFLPLLPFQTILLMISIRFGILALLKLPVYM